MFRCFIPSKPSESVSLLELQRNNLVSHHCTYSPHPIQSWSPTQCSVLHCSLPLDPNLFPIFTPHWLQVSVYESTCPQDPNPRVVSFQLDMPELYDACETGRYDFRQFVREDMYLFFQCQRVDPFTMPTEAVPSTTLMRRRSSTPPSHLHAMFPSLLPTFIDQILATFPTQEAAIDHLLNCQGNVEAPVSVNASDNARRTGPVGGNEHAQTDFEIAQQLQRLEEQQFDDAQREFEQQLLDGHTYDTLHPPPRVAPPAAAIPAAANGYDAAAQTLPSEPPALNPPVPDSHNAHPPSQEDATSQEHARAQECPPIPEHTLPQEHTAAQEHPPVQEQPPAHEQTPTQTHPPTKDTENTIAPDDPRPEVEDSGINQKPTPEPAVISAEASGKVLAELPTISPEQAQQALENTDGDPELAISLLLMQEFEVKPEARPPQEVPPHAPDCDSSLDTPPPTHDRSMSGLSVPSPPGSPLGRLDSQGSFDSVYPYAALKVPGSQLQAPQIDPRRREEYLSDAEFVHVLGCCREDFEKLPEWRRQKKKQETGLY